MSFVLDTNVFIYALDPADPDKHVIAKKLVNRWLSRPSTLPRQVLGEILNLGHKRRGPRIDICRELVATLEEAVVIVPTSREAILAASQRAERFHLQYWDALICTIAEREGIETIFTEDMHDGLVMGSLRVINPFTAENDVVVAGLLAG